MSMDPTSVVYGCSPYSLYGPVTYTQTRVYKIMFFSEHSHQNGMTGDKIGHLLGRKTKQNWTTTMEENTTVKAFGVQSVLAF